MSGGAGSGVMTGGCRPAAVALCALLAGCAGLPGAQVAEPGGPAQASEPRQASSEAETLLTYFTQIRKLSPPELAREHDSARQAYGGARSDYNRVRLAMVVALPNTSFYDEPRALDLLEPLAKTPGAQLSGLAFLLVSQIQERRRLDANAHALQQKLDALKSLERSLLERKR